MTRCPSVFPGLVRVRVALMSLRCLAMLYCDLLAVSFMIVRSILDLSITICFPVDTTDFPIFVRASRLHCKPEPIAQIFRLFASVGVHGAFWRKAAPRSPLTQCCLHILPIASFHLPKLFDVMVRALGVLAPRPQRPTGQRGVAGQQVPH